MHIHLQQLIDTNVLSFADIIDAYAQMCIKHTRENTEDMIEDEGVSEMIKNGVDITPEGLTNQAIEWALVSVPEIMVDDPEYARERENGLKISALEFIIREAVKDQVKATNAFKIKFS
jgi:hypothetical protein